MTPLERAIESLTDPSVPIADALRGLLVVGRRIAADDLTKWLRAELDGYEDGDEIPSYRRAEYLPILLRFDGPMGSSATRRLSRRDVPSELADSLDGIDFRQPVAELAALSDNEGESDPQMQLSMRWLQMYRNLADAGKAPYMEMMVLNHAALVIPRTRLRGVLDRVKSAALDLALGLEDVSLDAGAAGGPTVTSQPELAATVTIHMNQIFATNSSVAVRQDASVTNVQVGDVAGMLEAARSLLSPEGVKVLAEAIEEDGGEPAAQTRSFLDRVKGGAYVLGSGIGTNAAYDGLVHLLGSVFPGFS